MFAELFCQTRSLSFFFFLSPIFFNSFPRFSISSAIVRVLFREHFTGICFFLLSVPLPLATFIKFFTCLLEITNHFQLTLQLETHFQLRFLAALAAWLQCFFPCCMDPLLTCFSLEFTFVLLVFLCGNNALLLLLELLFLTFSLQVTFAFISLLVLLCRS